MTLGGWINLVLSLGFVLGLLVWCLVRLVRDPDKDPGHHAHLHPVEEEEIDQR